LDVIVEKTREVYEALTAVLPADRVLTASITLRPYSTDWYWKAQEAVAAGQPLGTPDLVVEPVSTEEVSAILQIATRLRVPVVPWGAGSGVNGGALAVGGGIVVDLKRMNAILRVDDTSLTATVQPGLICEQLEQHLNAEGLTFPHYPASADLGSIGGYLSCRGSGVSSTRYGKMEDLVLNVQVVLPGGEIIQTLPVPRHSCGPDLTQLFVGAEGTMGIITEATLQLAALPAGRSFCAAAFSEIQDGLEAGRHIMRSGLRPAVMRFYDDVAARHSLSKAVGPLDGPTMVIVCEGDADVAALEAQKCLSLCQAHGGQELSAEISATWWDKRLVFYKPPHYPTLPAMWGTIDVVTTYERAWSTYQAMRAMLTERYGPSGLQLATHFSHWYDWGTMLYCRFTLPTSPADPSEAIRLHDQIWHDGVTLALDHGAVMNDHHGVGIKLAPYMPRQWGAAFGTLGAIKGTLDPAGIMNPGKLGLGRNDDQR